MTRAEAERLAGLPVKSPIRSVEPLLDSRALMLLACKALGISLSKILGPDRHSDTVAARRVICAVLRAKGLSYPVIGARIGLDHTTVIHHVKRFDETAAARPELRLVFDALAPGRRIEAVRTDIEALQHRISDIRLVRRAQERRRAREMELASARLRAARRAASLNQGSYPCH